MYEVTVSVPQAEQYLLQHIREQTMPQIVEMDGIATDLQDKHRCYFSVACSDTYRFQLKRAILENVAEAVALGYKNAYVRKYLKVSKGNFFQNVLINTMCVFDKSYDQKIIAKILDADKPVFVDGYCNFRLDILKRKWQEIAKLVCENNYILHDRQLILEFLQYLLESVNNQIENLTLSLEKDGFMMYDTDGKVLPFVKSLASPTSTEEEAAVNVLLLKPKHVTVYFAQKPSSDFCKLMELFDCKFKCTT